MTKTQKKTNKLNNILMIQEILAWGSQYEQWIKRLKQKSPYYPKYYREKKVNYGLRPKDKPIEQEWISTLVRVKRDDKWYKVHLVDFMNTDYPFEDLLDIFHHDAAKINLLYVPQPGFDDLDERQIEESERIISDYYPQLAKQNPEQSK